MFPRLLMLTFGFPDFDVNEKIPIGPCAQGGSTLCGTLPIVTMNFRPRVHFISCDEGRGWYDHWP